MFKDGRAYFLQPDNVPVENFRDPSQNNPSISLTLVVDIVLGIMSKAAPGINVFELGFAIRGILGVLIYFLSIGLVATQMGKLSVGMINQVERVIKLLSFS